MYQLEENIVCAIKLCCGHIIEYSGSESVIKNGVQLDGAQETAGWYSMYVWNLSIIICIGVLKSEVK